MKLDLENNRNDVPHFKGGIGTLLVSRFDDPDMGAIVRVTLPVGTSIGLHRHEGNCEVVYCISGKGYCYDDDQEYPFEAGMCHYCKDGHTHSIVNKGDTTLELLGILPNSK